MALSKSLLLPSGVTPTYWRITSLQINRLGKTASICISGFLNGTVSQGLTGKSFLADSSVFDSYFSTSVDNNFYAKAYEFLKTQPFFSDASDV